MVDFVVLEGEHLGKAAADFVERRHGNKRLPSIEPSDLRGGNGNRIEVVVPELTGSYAAFRVVAKVRAVCVPFAHSRRGGKTRFLGRDSDAAAEHRNAAALGRR